MSCQETNYQKWVTKIYDTHKKQGGTLEFMEFVNIFDGGLRCIYYPNHMESFKSFLKDVQKIKTEINEKSVQLSPAN